MKILITGGRGFIARSLEEALAPRHEIYAPDSGTLDLTDTDAVADALWGGNFDIVIHAANYDAAAPTSMKDPKRVLDKNLRMFFNLVRCIHYFPRLIYFGSGAECAQLPADPYGLSKYIMAAHAERYRGRIINLRLYGVFGKYDDWRYRLIPNLCAQAALGWPLLVKKDAVYDFLYIDDLINVVEWAMGYEGRAAGFDVCSGSPRSFMEYARIVSSISGVEIMRPPDASPRKECYGGNNTRLLLEMGGYEFTPINKAIEAVYTWYKDHLELLDSQEVTKWL